MRTTILDRKQGKSIFLNTNLLSRITIKIQETILILYDYKSSWRGVLL